MQLTPEQVSRYNRDGHLFLEGVFSTEEDRACCAGRPISCSRAAARKSGARTMVRRAPRLPRTATTTCSAALGAHPRLIRPVEQLLGESVYMHQYKVNAKAAFDGAVWQWHQDFGTWHRDDGMPEPHAMNIAVFLDPVTAANGPLMFLTGSHREGIFQAGHDLETTSYPLWTLDRETVARLAGEGGIAAPTGEPGLGGDVPRQPRPCEPAQYQPVGPGDRLSQPLRGLQPHHALQARGVDRAPGFPTPSCRFRTTASHRTPPQRSSPPP